MMNKTFGILAHVDAGKTTLSEQILFCTNSIRNLGRVDHKNTFLDTNDIEKRRGITIFSDQAVFEYNDNTYYLIDTPGHVDFSGETERALLALDYAVLIISGTSGVESHTLTLFNLLTKYKIPTFIFVNKMDLETSDKTYIFKDIRSKLKIEPFLIDLELLPILRNLKNSNMNKHLYNNNLDNNYLDKNNNPNINPNLGSLDEDTINDFLERIIDLDENLMEAYLEDILDIKKCIPVLLKKIKSMECIPLMYGSALINEGVSEFIEVFDMLTETEYSDIDSFIGRVYKIRHDKSGNRQTFIKILSGHLKVKDEIDFTVNYSGQSLYSTNHKKTEKINQILQYNGCKSFSKDMAFAGECIAVTGLSIPICGSLIGCEYEEFEFLLKPALTSKINILDGTDAKTVFNKLKILEAEDPMLRVDYKSDTSELHIQVMGKIQLEILKEHLLQTYSLSVDFEKPEILYKETIANNVIGCGHFEPLRHYAEVILRMEPNKRGMGITFSSECSTDLLNINFQNLIRTHVFEKTHIGILNGSPITDIHITLLNGKSHIKHTEGGDFREATYRAIRQGLEKAENVLLEPYYSFIIYVKAEYLGKILSDIPKLNGTFDPPDQNDDIVLIKGRGPAFTLMDYPLELTSSTKGTGTIHFEFDGYDICHNADIIIESKAYNKILDKENTSSSVFCSKGQSFIVSWDEADNYMHCLK